MIIEQLLSGEIKLDLPDESIYRKIKERWDSAAKPLDSLGRFEELTAKIGAALGDVNVDISKRAVIVMCADNGIVEEGISQSGQEVTLAVARAMGRHASSVCKMAAISDTDVIPYDIGINTDETVPGLKHKKVAKGTKNFAKEHAMSREELLLALETGIEAVKEARENGCRILGTGEMGIGNTTTSAAVASALLKCPARDMVGKGSGLGKEGLLKKEKVIEEALIRYGLYDKGPLEVLEAVGGFDIAGMCGVMIGGALYHIPVAIDGVISAVSALAAVKLFPEVSHYIVASHMSKEPAARKILSELSLEPVITADMALGEGTGTVMLFRLLDIALTLYVSQLTFDDLEMEAYTRFDEEHEC